MMYIVDPYFVPNFKDRVRKYNSVLAESKTAIENFRKFLGHLDVSLNEKNQFRILSFDFEIVPKVEKSFRHFKLIFCLVQENESGRKKLTEVGRLNYSGTGTLLDDIENTEFYHSLIEKAEGQYELLDLK